MADKEMILEYVIQKHRDTEIIHIANNRADENGDDRPDTVGSLLTDLRSEIEYIDEMLTESSDEDKADLVLRRDRIDTIIKKLISMGVNEDNDIPLINTDEADQQEENNEDEENNDEDDEGANKLEAERSVEVAEKSAIFEIAMDVVSGDPDVLYLSFGSVIKMNSKAKALGIQAADDSIDEDIRTFHWDVPSKMFLAFLDSFIKSVSNRAEIRIDVLTPEQRRIAITNMTSDQLVEFNVHDWDGEALA